MKKKICVVIPCYKVSNKIDDVIKQIDFNIVDKIFLIDDCCPENTGKLGFPATKQDTISVPPLIEAK